MVLTPRARHNKHLSQPFGHRFLPCHHFKQGNSLVEIVRTNNRSINVAILVSHRRNSNLLRISRTRLTITTILRTRNSVRHITSNLNLRRLRVSTILRLLTEKGSQDAIGTLYQLTPIRRPFASPTRRILTDQGHQQSHDLNQVLSTTTINQLTFNGTRQTRRRTKNRRRKTQ